VLKEKFMKAAANNTQMSKETGLNIKRAMAPLKSI
jgi:hypothetical protein